MQTLYTLVLFPLIYFIFWLLSFKNSKIKEGFASRRHKSWIQPYDTNARWVWFHVASGELEYAKPVIAKIKKRPAPLSSVSAENAPSPEHRAVKILVTFFSPSVVASLKKTTDIDLFVPMPWDTPWHWREFIGHYKPRCLAIARTDTWPNMIWSANKYRIPSILFSATLPSTSARAASFFTRLFYGTVIDKLTHVSAVTQDDVDNFRRLDEELSLSADGDTRFDQVISRVAERRPLSCAVQNLSTTFVVGSSWPEDEKVILPALKKPIEAGLNVIVAPHEPTPEHVDSLEKQFAALGLITTRYSAAAAMPTPALAADLVADLRQNATAPLAKTTGVGVHAAKPGTIIIVDIVGVLADLYRVGTIAFVGGSFKKSVHSVMEPAAAGCLTLFGPYHHNNREALAMRAAKLALEVENTDEIETILLNELKIDSSSLTERTGKILSFVGANRGVSEKIARWIFEHSN